MTSMKTAKKRLLRYLISISVYSAFLFPFLSRLSSANSSSSSLSSTASGHHDVDVTTEESAEEPSASSSFLLLCTTDGNLFTIDAWSGELSSTVSTDPLLRKNRASTKKAPNHDGDEDEESSFSSKMTTAIVPGLDGRLYSYMEHEKHHHDGSNNKNFHPPQLQALPLTIHSILENPVRSCPSPNPEDCGILTATAQTTLLALDEKGHLLWKSREGSFATENHNKMKEKSAIPPPLLLQRKDYWVQHVSTMTGQQAWNVSLGTYQALDFATAPIDDDQEEEEEDVDLEILLGEKQELQSSLPAIAFSNAGRTLTAIDPDTGAVLWQQTTPSVLSSVFGINRGQWKALTVLEDKGFDDGPILEQNAEGLKFAVTRQRLPNNMDSQPEDEFSDIWSQAAWEAAQTFYHKQQLLERGDDGSSSPQRLLPGRDLHQEAVCLPGDCPRFLDPRYKRLGLPSPDDVKFNYRKPRRHHSSEGLLLPWRLVGMIVSLTVMLVFGLRLWYVNKKKKWLTETKAKKESKMAWHASISMDGSRRVKDSRLLKRSMSLPGVLKAATSPMTTSDSENFQPGDGDIRNEEPALSIEEKQPDEGPQVVQQGGIPLVRYSRYASEFTEIAAMGKGGFGTVFRCKNGLDGREYAIKKVSIKGAVNDKSFQQKLQRVVREVKILALLDHPNIVRYYTAWLEMEAEDKSNATTPRRGVHENSESELSRCYSSSLLLTDSVSQWDPPSPIRNPRHARVATDNPLGWDPLGIPEESSMSLRRSFRQNDDEKDGLYFEDTKNEDGETDTVSRRDTSTRRDDEESTTWVTDTDNQDKNTNNGSSVNWEEEPGNEAAALTTTKSTPVSRQESPESTSMRHTLYIQMQLCSEHTVVDFLVDDTARRGGAESGVDIPTALQLFLQISQAVAYVHEQGMIHRDLKPSNCFMDALGNIKVGDFGLSRESGGDNDTAILDTSQSQLKAFNDDHTAGVGTRSYASPEQTNGSDYDSSTDIYSLGIMLFELCYPMYTGMERNICLSRLRDHSFPKDWVETVGVSFPTLQDLICSMLSRTPSARPTAKTVVEAIQSILGEFTLVSIDSSMHEGPDMILLRVEADHEEDVLGRTMELIRSAAAEEEGDNTFQIAQYGLRSSSSSERPAAIMEFAVRTPDPKKQGPKLVSSLSEKPEIRKVRQISQTISKSS